MTTIKFEASDEEVNGITDELKKWEDEDLLREVSLLEGSLPFSPTEEEIQKLRVGYLTLGVAKQELTKRGFQFSFVRESGS